MLEGAVDELKSKLPEALKVLEEMLPDASG
jgi:hypothetical protein